MLVNLENSVLQVVGGVAEREQGGRHDQVGHQRGSRRSGDGPFRHRSVCACRHRGPRPETDAVAGERRPLSRVLRGLHGLLAPGPDRPALIGVRRAVPGGRRRVRRGLLEPGLERRGGRFAMPLDGSRRAGYVAAVRSGAASSSASLGCDAFAWIFPAARRPGATVVQGCG